MGCKTWQVLFDIAKIQIVEVLSDVLGGLREICGMSKSIQTRLGLSLPCL